MTTNQAKQAAIQHLRAALTRGFVDGSYDWNRDPIESTLKMQFPVIDPLSDPTVKGALVEWQAKGLIELTGKDRPFLRVKKVLM